MNEVLVVFDPQVPPAGCADDSHRDRLSQTKRISDREYDVAGTRFLAIGKRDRGEIFLVDFQQRHVSAWIGADFPSLVFSEVYPEAYHDFFRARNNVVGSENISVWTDNHAGAEALQSLFALSLGRLSTEKLAQRVVAKRKCG